MDILRALSEGKRGAVAQAGQVAEYVIENPSELADLIGALRSGDTVVVAHAAHALLSVFKKNDLLLETHKALLLDIMQDAEQWEILEQLGKILPHLEYNDYERDLLAQKTIAVLENSRSSIARTCALEALWTLAQTDSRFEKHLQDMMEFCLQDGTKAMQARARKLFSQ